MEKKEKEITEKKEELFIPKTKHKALKIILAIILIAGLIVGGYFLYQYKFNSPKMIVNNVINDAKENFQSKIDESKKEELYKVDGHIKFESNINDETFKVLKDIELLFKGEINSKESFGNIDINTKYKNDELANIKAYYEKDVVYLLLDGIYDKYLKVDTKDEKESIPKINLNSSKDIYVVYHSLLKAFEIELDKLEFKQENDTITIDGKETKVINNYVELKDKEVNELAKGIVNTLLKDQEFLTAINNITGEDYKEKLNETLEGINEEEFQGVYRINFYTDKGLFKKKLVSVRQTILVEGVSMSVNVDKISDEEVFMSISSTGITYAINVKSTNSMMNIIFSLNTMGQYINFEINMNYETIKEVTKPDVSNSKDINTLTEKEKQDIENKLKSNKALLKLIEELNKVGKQEA